MPGRLRIAHIVGNLETGGTQTLLIEIMRRLDRERFDPFLIHFKDPNHFADEARSRGWECHKLRASRSYRTRELRSLAGEIRRLAPDIVHTHSDFANFAGRAAAVAAAAPYTVVHYQNTYEHRLDDQFRRLEAHLAPYTDAFIACSKGVEKFLAENLDLAGRPVHLFQNSVDLEPYVAARRDRAEARARCSVADDVFHIVHTARLEPHKQPQMLFRALALTHQKADHDLGNWRLTLVGDGSMREELKGELARLDEELAAAGRERMGHRVHFAGWSKDIAVWLAAADLFCLVSRNEGLPLSLVEAMAAGAPTLAPNIIGPQEVILDNEFGLLVDSSRPEEIRDGLLRYRRDESWRRLIIEKGIARAREFSVDQFVKRLEVFYGDLAKVPGLCSRAPLGFLQRSLFLYRMGRLGRQKSKRGKARAR